MAQWMTKKALTPVRMKKSWPIEDDFYPHRPHLQGNTPGGKILLKNARQTKNCLLEKDNNILFFNFKKCLSF